MDDAKLLEQAAELEQLFPRIQRKLFTLAPEHPVNDLPLGQLRLCSTLQSGPRTITALSEEMGTSLSAVTQIADRLERTGLVERVADSEDRRVKHLRLTEHGAELMGSRRQTRIVRAADALASLSPFERDQVLSVLARLLEAAAGDNSVREDAASVRTAVH